MDWFSSLISSSQIFPQEPAPSPVQTIADLTVQGATVGVAVADASWPVFTQISQVNEPIVLSIWGFDIPISLPDFSGIIVQSGPELQVITYAPGEVIPESLPVILATGEEAQIYTDAVLLPPNVRASRVLDPNRILQPGEIDRFTEAMPWGGGWPPAGLSTSEMTEEELARYNWLLANDAGGNSYAVAIPAGAVINSAAMGLPRAIPWVLGGVAILGGISLLNYLGKGRKK